MRQRSPDPEDLDLPPLDGTPIGDEDEEHGPGDHAPDDDDLDDVATRDVPDAFDDSTGETETPALEPDLERSEGGMLDDEDDAPDVDVGVFDVSLGEELPTINVLGDDDGEPPVADEDLGGDEDDRGGDSGEEGPLADDEELREEDLPELDADEDGDVDDASLFEGASIGLEADEELRWADRAWARIGQTKLPAADPEPDQDDSGLLAVPGDDPKLAGRDAAWRRLEENADITAAAFLPGDSVVVALFRPERSRLVRIQPDGVARIIAEIESSGDDDTIDPRVTALRWDGARGAIVAVGAFGAQAFRPT